MRGTSQDVLKFFKDTLNNTRLLSLFFSLHEINCQTLGFTSLPYFLFTTAKCFRFKVWIQWFGEHTHSQMELSSLKSLEEGLVEYRNSKRRKNRYNLNSYLVVVDELILLFLVFILYHYVFVHFIMFLYVCVPAQHCCHCRMIVIESALILFGCQALFDTDMMSCKCNLSI